MSQRTKFIVQLLVLWLPWGLRRRLLNLLPGFELAPGSLMGLSIAAVDEFRMGPGARIAHLTLLKGLCRVELGACASIGRGNWITGFPLIESKHFAHLPHRRPQLLMDAHSAITNRHIIDCTDTVTIGAFATFAGFRSQILTHSIDICEGRQTARPVSIGAYSFVGTGVVLLPGSALPNHSVLAAGSVLHKAHEEPYRLYAGNPAVIRSTLDDQARYFLREQGFVH